ncbi:MAG: glycosyltransferase family 4 protein [Bacteroidales bacterium]
MKVLYISYDGMTDSLGRSQVIPYLEGLAGRGHNIHVISCEKKYLPQKERSIVERLFAQKNIQWYPLSFSEYPRGISKLFDVYRIKAMAGSLHKREDFDIIHCRSYIAALAGLELKKKQGVRFVFDMRGFWADERLEGKIWNDKNPAHRLAYRYFKKKEKLFFENADAVVSLTQSGKDVIETLFGKEVKNKTNVIPCCVDTEMFSRENITSDFILQLKSKLNIGEKDFVLSYLGSLGTWYMIDEMLVFFKKLLIRYPQSKFLFISGDDPNYIKDKARKLQIEEGRIIIAKALREEVPAYLMLSDLSLFFIKPVFSKKASSPTKQAEIMSMGIPAICNSGVGDTDLIFAGNEAGLVLKDFSEAEMERVISRLDEILKLDPIQIRRKAINLFSLDEGVARYDEIYKAITSNK